MSRLIYRYAFPSDLKLSEVEAGLVRAVQAVEHLHGEAAARLEARYHFDDAGRRCVIDASSLIGVELNKLFAGAITREFGPDAFVVERVMEPSAGGVAAS